MSSSEFRLRVKGDEATEVEEVEGELIVEDYILALRSPFGTSHSSSTTRCNALILLRLGPSGSGVTVTGYGEIGLPPKKPGCYEADVEDVKEYVRRLLEDLRTTQTSLAPGTEYDPFYKLPHTYFAPFRRGGTVRERAIRSLFYAIDHCSANDWASSRAARSGVEMALLDLWGRMRKMLVYEMMGVDPTPRPSFYTAAMMENLENLLQSVRFGRHYTPYLKIKLDGDVAKGKKILQSIHAFCQEEGGDRYVWSIDANAAWTPSIALAYLNVLLPYASRVLMIEQPFPLGFGPESDRASQIAWQRVRASYETAGMYLYADESVSTAEDAYRLQPWVHGVNFKLEKAGGLREVVRGLCTAQDIGLKTWVGMMVASRLNCTAAAQALPLAEYGDLDGALLVTEESQHFQGGFSWGTDADHRGHILLPRSSVVWGLGCLPDS